MTRMNGLAALAAVVALAFGSTAEAQRGGRGGGGMQRGGGGGGGMSRGGFGGGMPSGGAGGSRSMGAGPYGGSGSSTRSRESFQGANGGQYTSGSRSGTYDTQRGGTINYGAAGGGGTTAGGASGARGVYGVSGTTAGGRSYSDYGRVGGVSGPGGNAAVGRSNVYGASGPNGSVAGGSRYGAASTPYGAAAGGERFGAASTPYGAAAGGERYGAATTAHGGAAWGQAGAVAARPNGTYYHPNAALAAQGSYYRGAYATTNYASPAFYASQPGAWAGAAALASAAPAANWGAVAGFAGYPQQPVYNDYGGNVVSQDNTMYVNGDPSGTPQQYAQQAGQIAASGASAQPDANGDWQPLGVYAMASADQGDPSEFFQLALNKQGLIRGNYHNAQANTTTPVSGSVDPKTMRAAWVIGSQKAPVYEAGIANLTNDQATMLVHDAQGQSRQTGLFRLPPPQPNGDATPAPAGR